MSEILRFLAYTIFFYLLPGWQTSRRLKLNISFWIKLLVSLALGMAQLVVVAYLGRWLGSWWLVWALVGWGLFGILDLKKNFWTSKKQKIDWQSVGLIFLAIGFQLLVMVKSGTAYRGGLAFWGIHGHDGIWHLALMQELVNNWPPQNPGFAGVELQNYHYFFDLLGAEVFRVARVDLVSLYFRGLPFLLGLIANGLVFSLGKSLTGDRRGGRWAVFWFAFGSSLGFALPWLGKGSANWETAFWAMQPSTGLQNPPFYLSLVFLTAALVVLVSKPKGKLRQEYLWLPALLVGLTSVTKVYGWLVMVASLSTLGLWLIFRKKQKYLLQLALVSLSSGGLFYLLTSGGGAGFLNWNPGWFLRIMLEAPDRVNWPMMEVRRLNWTASGQWLKASLIWILGVGFFVGGNLGTRLVAFLKGKGEKFSLVEKILWVMVGIGFLPPMFFTQEYVAWNTIQFFYYSIFALGLLAAKGADSIVKSIKSKGVKFLFVFALVAFSIPGSLQTVSWYLGRVPTTLVSDQELAALDYLKTNSSSDAVVLVYPHRYEQEEKRPVPSSLADYNTAYVAFLANRRVYLEDETAALIQGYDFQARRLSAVNFFQTTDAQAAMDFLNAAGIDYVYLSGDQAWVADFEGLVESVYEQPGVRIYRVI